LKAAAIDVEFVPITQQLILLASGVCNWYSYQLLLIVTNPFPTTHSFDEIVLLKMLVTPRSSNSLSPMCLLLLDQLREFFWSNRVVV
jgi:hypothetical protein